MADDLKDAIKQNAQGPKRASADGVAAQQHPLADQIAADKCLAGKAGVAAGPAKGFVRVKIVPPGSA